MPGPPVGNVDSYPLAVDIDGDVGAVSWALLNAHPHIDTGWWCEAVMYGHGPGGWGEITAGDDNTTSPTPFERPKVVTNSTMEWMDWGSQGGLAVWGEPGDSDHIERHVLFGIAPVGTARLTVTTPDGRERDLRITPWNGAYVAVVEGDDSLLTGFGHGGELLGTIARQHAGPGPEGNPPPGWRAVGDGGADVWIREDAD